MTPEPFHQPMHAFHTLVCRRRPAWTIGTKARPGLRSGINSGAGRRRQPPSPEQRQPRVAREMYAGACPQLGVEWGAQMTPEPFHQPMHPIFMPWCAGGGRHGRLVQKHVPDSDPGSIPAPADDTNHRRPNNDCRGSQEKCSAGAGPQLGVGWGAQMTPDPSINQCTHFMPWCAGGGRHGRLVQKHVPDSDPGSIPAPAGDANHRRPNNDCRGSQEKCSAGAGP